MTLFCLDFWITWLVAILYMRSPRYLLSYVWVLIVVQHQIVLNEWYCPLSFCFLHTLVWSVESPLACLPYTFHTEWWSSWFILVHSELHFMGQAPIEIQDHCLSHFLLCPSCCFSYIMAFCKLAQVFPTYH